MRILIGAPVNQSPDIFAAYLAGLDALDTTGLQVDRLFVLHNSPGLAQLLREQDAYVLHDTQTVYWRDEHTHRWNDDNIRQVVSMKNWLIGYALREGYDALLIVDSDLILHPQTLQALVAAEKPVVAEVFWTRWEPQGRAQPNAWIMDANHWDEGDLAQWSRPGLYRVAGTGACILIRREVLEAGVNYSPLYNVSWWGEDRHFCLRVAAHGFEVWLDTHHPATHLYRRSAYDRYMGRRRPRIVGAMLVRNEAGRWLETILGQLRQVCDRVVVLDDASTDDTPQICERLGAEVHRSRQSLWETNEVAQRRRLWDLAADAAGPGGWVLNLDADETLAPDTLEQLPLAVARATVAEADAIGFLLHDMWSETHYRDDPLWTAHHRLWPLCVRVDSYRPESWPDRALHCGRFPQAVYRVVDPGLRVQHWGWSRPEDRQAKHDRYMRIDGAGRFGVLAQYQSILDPAPHLVPWVD